MKKSVFEAGSVFVGVFVAASLFATACGKSDAPSGASGTTPLPTAVPAAAVVLDAKSVFNERCSPCHGTSGKGDGPAAASLTPKPRNYTDKTWQTSVTDEQIKKTIVYGGAAVGKSAVMPSSPDLDGKPEVVDGLVKIVRGFGPP